MPMSARASGGRVVDAVARHGDDLAARLQLLDQGQLLVRAHPAANRLGRQPELAADGLGGGPLIAGEHHGANAGLAARRDRLLDPRPHRVGEGDQAEERQIVDRPLADRVDGAPRHGQDAKPLAGQRAVGLENDLAVRIAEGDGVAGRLTPAREIEHHARGSLDEDRLAPAGRVVERRHHAARGIERDLAPPRPRARDGRRIESGLRGGHEQRGLGRIAGEAEPVRRRPPRSHR